MSDPELYTTRRLYLWLTLLGLGVVLLFGWELSRASFDVLLLFFLLTSLFFTLVNLRWSQMSLELTPSGLTVHQPLAPPFHIDFRQMVAVTQAGRSQPGVSIVYYPVDARGLVDTERPRSLFLPAVDRQEELLAVLNREMPKTSS